MTARRVDSRDWYWALVDAALEVTCIWPIREYLWSQEANIAEYVAGRLIYELCTFLERVEGSSKFLRWWNQ